MTNATNDLPGQPANASNRWNRQGIRATFVIRLDDTAATELFHLLGEWL